MQQELLFQIERYVLKIRIWERFSNQKVLSIKPYRSTFLSPQKIFQPLILSGLVKTNVGTCRISKGKKLSLIVINMVGDTGLRHVWCTTVGLKIGAHFYFVSLISQRVFNFRSPTIAYDNPQLQQIVISYSIFDGEYVAVKLWGTQNL